MKQSAEDNVIDWNEE